MSVVLVSNQAKGLLLLSASSVNFSTHHFPGPEKDKEGGCIDMYLALHSLTAMELCPLLIFRALCLWEESMAVQVVIIFYITW